MAVGSTKMSEAPAIQRRDDVGTKTTAAGRQRKIEAISST